MSPNLLDIYLSAKSSSDFSNAGDSIATAKEHVVSSQEKLSVICLSSIAFWSMEATVGRNIISSSSPKEAYVVDSERPPPKSDFDVAILGISEISLYHFSSQRLLRFGHKKITKPHSSPRNAWHFLKQPFCGIFVS